MCKDGPFQRTKLVFANEVTGKLQDASQDNVFLASTFFPLNKF